jgi:hypothetical protein
MPEPEDDAALVDRDGKPADKKIGFELERKVLGRAVRGVRFCSNEEYEEGKRGMTLVLSFEDGGDFMMAVESPAKVEFFISMSEENTTSGKVM